MSAARLIKRRIKSAKNISQITKAMEMVAASKMKRAQDQALSSRPYAEKLSQMLHVIARRTNATIHPLLKQNDSNKVLVVLLSSDRGLAGGLNTNLFKATEEFIRGKDVAFVVVGKKAKEYALKFGYQIAAEFTGLPEKVHFDQILPIAEFIMKSFLLEEYGEVHLMHMRFLSTLSQRPQIQQLLPLTYEELQQPEELITVTTEYVFEPSAKDILEFLLPYYIEIELFQTLLDAKASEQSARMVAMKSASDNAKEVVGELQLLFNKSRQAAITRELIEITTAATSLAA